MNILIRESKMLMPLNLLQNGSAFSAWFKRKLVQFDFPVPPFSLQQQFASIVADTERLRQKH